MEEKKKFEALQYSYENAGQFRAIAAILGYSEEYRNGDITFSKGNETYTYPLNTLKLGNLGDNRESLLEQSKERIISFFDKEQASNNFQEYSQYLRENHNVAIIKWDDIKQGTNKNEGYKDGFTVIDLENKIAYKGEDLYRYAYEQNQTLDGKGEEISMKGKISLYWKDSNNAGVKVHPVRPEIMNDINLKPKELERLQDNEIITKTINNEKYLVQLDPETNELLKTKIKSISIPSNIKGVELDKQQKETLKSGKELILNVDKEKIAIRLDLNNPRGIKFLDFEQKQKIAYDRHNPQIIGTIHTDKNRNEYIEYMKGQKTTLGNESQSKVEHKFKL